MKNLYQIIGSAIAIVILNFQTINAQSFTHEGVKNVENLLITPPAENTTTNFTLFNFITGEQVSIADSATANWHIGFWAENTGMVTRVILNSGVSGPGSVTGIVNNGVGFENFTSASGLVFTVDGATSATKVSQWNSGVTRLSQYNAASTISGRVLGSVFSQNSVTPVANRLLICQLEDGSYVKFELLSNYRNNPVTLPEIDAQAQADYGYISFRYLRSNSESFETGFSSKVSNLYAGNSHYTFYSFANGDTLSLADSSSGNWDVAFKGTTVLLNGGISGSGSTTGLVTVAGFNDIVALDGAGYVTDASDNKAIVTGSDNGWYHYDFASHVIAPIQGRTILVKTTDGKYVKLFITSYYKDSPSLPCNQATKYYSFNYVYDAYGTGTVNSSAILPAPIELPTIALTSSITSVSSLAGVYTLTVTGNVDWALGTLPGWITTSAQSGSGNSIVTITVADNANAERTAGISISACSLGNAIIITQAGASFASGITEFGSELSLFPNPVENVLFLNTNALVQQLSLYDVTGAAQSFSYVKIESGYQINTTSLKSGLYILKAGTGSESKIFKITKNQN